jgi:uncharacterized protein (DUF427 family)
MSTRITRPAPGPGQESVWDYPRPPRIEPTGRRVRVIVDGVVVADTTRALRVLETASPPTFYIPPDDVRLDLLVPESRHTVCEWKGEASYWTVQIGPRHVAAAGWSYPRPTPAFERIRDHLAFYAGRVDEAWVDDERVVPQPGDFYGGWVTSEIVGPFKGEPGTLGW